MHTFNDQTAFGAAAIAMLQIRYRRLVNAVDWITAEKPNDEAWQKLADIKQQLEQVIAEIRALGNLGAITPSEMVVISASTAPWPLIRDLIDRLLEIRGRADRADFACWLTDVLVKHIDPLLHICSGQAVPATTPEAAVTQAPLKQRCRWDR